MFEKKTISMRQAFGEAMVELAEKMPKVVVLVADVGKSLNLDDSLVTTDFIDRFPERYLNVGVAEANMIGVGAGLALEGFIPFCVSFAAFLPGRCFDQIRVSVTQNQANVKLVGSHYGFSNPGDGMTAQSIEDIALMRVLPGMMVLAPADAKQTKEAVMEMAETTGPAYLRISRLETPLITEGFGFEIGKAQVLREGKKVTVVGHGSILSEALQAAEAIDAEVINCHTIKPLDEETILKSVAKTGRVITIEEHSIYGGLGSAVAELVSQKYPVPIRIMGVNDKFGESARSYRELVEKHGLIADNIIAVARETFRI